MSAPHDRTLTQHRVLVTGGGRGIGRGIAKAMAKAGARVAVASRTKEQVDRVAAEIEGGSSHVFNVTDFASIPAFIDEVEEALGGGITTVVHSAGTQHRQKAEEFELSAFRHVVEVNLIAPFALSQEIGRRQLEREAVGQHIFIGSLTSFISLPEVSAYGASKTGILGLVRSLSSEWSSKSIRVNGIAPGYIRTELTEAVFADEERRSTNLARIPMARFGEPSDIANVAVFLASEASAYVTGQMISVDGGWLAA